MLRITENFTITCDSSTDQNIGYDGENLARTLSVFGSVDTAAVYYLETENKDGKKFWSMEITADGLQLPLTSALLSAPGYYTAQVSQHYNDVVRKTNCFLLRVGESVNAVETAPPVEPNLFEVQIAQMADYLQQAEEVLEQGQIDISAERTARENADNALDQRVTYLEEHGGGGTGAVTSVNGQTGDVTIPEATPYDDSEIRGQVAELNRELINLDGRKMEYKILTFTGSAFTLDGQTLTFAQIKELCLNKKDFVYALYANRLYIPQYISNSNVFFEASYIQSDIPKMHRISINSSNQVSQYSFDLAKVTDIPTAVKVAMCDGIGEAWTADERLAARLRQGADANEFTPLIDVTLEERGGFIAEIPELTTFSAFFAHIVIPQLPDDLGNVHAQFGGHNLIPYVGISTVSMSVTMAHIIKVHDNMYWSIKNTLNGIPQNYTTTQMVGKMNFCEINNNTIKIAGTAPKNLGLSIGTQIQLWGKK